MYMLKGETHALYEYVACVFCDGDYDSDFGFIYQVTKKVLPLQGIN